MDDHEISADPPGRDDEQVESHLRNEIDPVMVTMAFHASDPDTLLAVLSNYVVRTRNERGARNIDLVASITKPDHYLIIEKWDSIDHQRDHFDGSVMVEMARACNGLLAEPPVIDLLEGVTMHDLA